VLKVLFALQVNIPAMNKKASNSENAARDKPHPGKSGSECDSARKENLLEHGGDMEPPTEGMMFQKQILYYNCLIQWCL